MISGAPSISNITPVVSSNCYYPERHMKEK